MFEILLTCKAEELQKHAEIISAFVEYWYLDSTIIT